ncbi:MAG: nitroreductase family deazaflavin-dependent oxidoreductase [Candidatus Rokuibacteriota bacterium]
MAHAEPQFLYLTTTGRRTGLPREIEIWFTIRRRRYYLVAEHGERANWVRNIRAEPRVLFRIGDRTYCGHARVVAARAEPALAAAARRRSEKKYGWGRGLVVELAGVE